MPLTSQHLSIPSLADVAVGQTVVVVEVLFELVRRACEPLVGRLGETMHCARRDADAVVLRAADGSEIRVDAAHARFIAVRRLRAA